MSREACNSSKQAASSDVSLPAGVYVGCMYHEYIDVMSASGYTLPPQAFIGNGPPYMVGRLSYIFGLTGPCVSTDTACSSSLVATHLAARAIVHNEVHAATAGGINAMLLPQTTAGISQLQALSTVGRCRCLLPAQQKFPQSSWKISFKLSSTRLDIVLEFGYGHLSQNFASPKRMMFFAMQASLYWESCDVQGISLQKAAFTTFCTWVAFLPTKSISHTWPSPFRYLLALWDQETSSFQSPCSSGSKKILISGCAVDIFVGFLAHKGNYNQLYSFSSTQIHQGSRAAPFHREIHNEPVMLICMTWLPNLISSVPLQILWSLRGWVWQEWRLCSDCASGVQWRQ